MLQATTAAAIADTAWLAFVACGASLEAVSPASTPQQLLVSFCGGSWGCFCIMLHELVTLVQLVCCTAVGLSSKLAAKLKEPQHWMSVSQGCSDPPL